MFVYKITQILCKIVFRQNYTNLVFNRRIFLLCIPHPNKYGKIGWEDRRIKNAALSSIYNEQRGCTFALVNGVRCSQEAKYTLSTQSGSASKSFIIQV